MLRLMERQFYCELSSSLLSYARLDTVYQNNFQSGITNAKLGIIQIFTKQGINYTTPATIIQRQERGTTDHTPCLNNEEINKL